jgi:hypothetical protein
MIHKSYERALDLITPESRAKLEEIRIRVERDKYYTTTYSYLVGNDVFIKCRFVGYIQNNEFHVVDDCTNPNRVIYVPMQTPEEYMARAPTHRPIFHNGNVYGVGLTPHPEELVIIDLFSALLPQPIAEELAALFHAHIAERNDTYDRHIYKIYPFASADHFAVDMYWELFDKLPLDVQGRAGYYRYDDYIYDKLVSAFNHNTPSGDIIMQLLDEVI